MDIIKLTNRQQLARYFQKDIYLHLYSLGDLDDFYWSRSTYYGIESKGEIDKVILVYKGVGDPILLALSQPGYLEPSYIKHLFPMLPDTVYAHLNLGLEKAFTDDYSILDHGVHYKMGLEDADLVRKICTEGIVKLTEKNLNEMVTLYQLSYPGNAFDPQMVLSGQYFGYREKGKLVSVGGIHVYSPTYRVAAIGNITTHPKYRNQGLGRKITARLCVSLLKNVDLIGLNVKADNYPAIAIYQSLGFRISGKYGEFSLKKA